MLEGKGQGIIEVYCVLALNGPIPDKVKTIKLNFYFHTSLWCLKTFWGTTKKCENENLTQFVFQYSFQKWTGLWGFRLFYLVFNSSFVSFQM